MDAALNQADLMAHLIAEEMSLGDMMTLLKLRRGEYSIVEEKAHPESPAIGKQVHELALPEKCILTAILRRGHLILPRGNTVIEEADEIIAVVHSSAVADLATALGHPPL